MSPFMLIFLICAILSSCVYCGKKNNEDIIVINNGGGGGCGGGAKTIVKTAGGMSSVDKSIIFIYLLPLIYTSVSCLSASFSLVSHR